MAVVLADLLDEKQIELELRARTRDEALREIVDLLQRKRKISDAEKFLAAVIDRERNRFNPGAAWRRISARAH